MSDFSSYEFVEGKTYSVEVEPGSDAVRVTEHGEGHPQPQSKYASLEYLGPIGSGPWRRFKDWESEADVTINSHHIIAVEH